MKSFLLISMVILWTINLLSQSNPQLSYNYRVNYLTIEEGLSNNKVNSICKDKYGFIWFGTNEGLNRYDGYNITTYTHEKSDSFSINNNLIRSIVLDNTDKLWIGTDDGMCYYNPDTDGFQRVMIGKGGHDLNFVWELFEDPLGTLWIATHHGLYYKKKDSTQVKEFKTFNTLVNNPHVISVFVDSKNNLWAGTRNYGLLFYNFGTNKSLQFSHTPGDKTTISSNRVETIYEDKKGNIWIGTSKAGLNLYNNKTLSFSRIVLRNENPEITVRDIAEDKHDRLWVGTNGGLYLKNTGSKEFTLFAHTDSTLTCLNHNSVFNINIDEIDIMWLATYAGGVNYIDMNQKKFNHFSTIGKENYSLNSNTVYTIYEDSKNDLWIGTVNGGVNHYIRSTGKFEYILYDPENKNSLSSNNVKAIIEDETGNFWFGTYKGGLNYYNTKTKTYKHYRAQTETAYSLSNDNVYDLLLDSEENLWIATEEGLDVWPKEGKKIIHTGSDSRNLDLFKGDITNCVYEDSKNNIWVGTYNHGLLLLNKKDTTFNTFKEDTITGIVYSIAEDHKKQLWISSSNGLYYLNLLNNSIINYSKKDGLPVTRVFKTYDDNEGNLWFSTTVGISKFINGVITPHIPNFRNYDMDDGLQSKQFVYNSHDKSRSGQLYFGGINGFNSFYPQEIKNNPYSLPVAITSLKIFNNEVTPGEKVEGKTILTKQIINTNEIELSYKHYVFTIQFAALHFAQPDKIKYAYRLEGFDPKEKDWNYTTTDNRNATYTNLNGGEYIFKVKATNNDGVWHEVPTVLKITVLPPFYKTWLFRIIAVISIVSLVIAFYLYRIRSIHFQKEKLALIVKFRTQELAEKNNILEERHHEIEMQARKLMLQKEELEKMNKKLAELNATKDKFFSIIAHDLKNPFQTIAGFAELLQTRFEKLHVDKKLMYINMIVNTTKQTYGLLENLLNWSRSQTNNIKFEPMVFSIKEIIKENLLLLKSSFTKKDISVQTKLTGSFSVFADKNMINTVIRNLLTNSIKYTPSEGTIKIESKQTAENIVISIHDTGIGMTPEQVESLFEIDKTRSRQGTEGEMGTGLGLILCKEFMDKNQGDLWVESEPDNGSTFYISLPVSK